MSNEPPQTCPPGALFIIAAPSGAGKTSLIRELLARDTGLVLSVSHTTRPKRAAEIDGVHYHFITLERFDQMIAQGAFLEHARVFGSRYGTSAQAVDLALQSGKDVVLEIDWQGARQVRQRYPLARGIFILPPSEQALRQRLEDRAQDSRESIGRRLAQACADMSHYDEYDYLLINECFPTAMQAMQTIVAAERLQTRRQATHHAGLIASLIKG